MADIRPRYGNFSSSVVFRLTSLAFCYRAILNLLLKIHGKSFQSILLYLQHVKLKVVVRLEIIEVGLRMGQDSNIQPNMGLGCLMHGDWSMLPKYGNEFPF